MYCYTVSSIPFKYEKFLNKSISIKDGTLTATTTADESGPRCNDKNGVLHTQQISVDILPWILDG